MKNRSKIVVLYVLISIALGSKGKEKEFVCVEWHRPLCGVTPAIVWSDTGHCVEWHRPLCGVTLAIVWSDTGHCVERHRPLCGVTSAIVWSDIGHCVEWHRPLCGVTSAIRHCNLSLICSHTQFWFVYVVPKYFQFATFQKIYLLSLCSNSVGYFLNDTQHLPRSLSTHFQTHLLTTYLFPQTAHLIYQPHKIHFVIKHFHAALLCAVTRCCSWPTVRSIKMEVSCDMT